MKSTKGFITIATGAEEYYKLAKNLLDSYHHFSKNPLPFAILCDRENEYTQNFDDVLIYKDGATNSYLDKLELGEYLPYDETIFIDADCLAYGDLNEIFKMFLDADEFCCFGRVLPLDDQTGWFEYENLGELKARVSYIVGLHGGIYYMRKSEKVRKVFSDAKAMVPDYAKYKFKGKFDTPGDEPLVALSMALNDCHPIPHNLHAICCYWEYLDNMQIDIAEGKAVVVSEDCIDTILIHWGTRHTRELLYGKQIKLLSIMEDASLGGAEKKKAFLKCNRHYDMLIMRWKVQKLLKRFKNKLMRMLHLK